MTVGEFWAFHTQTHKYKNTEERKKLKVHLAFIHGGFV
jgi:hypothetical protein